MAEIPNNLVNNGIFNYQPQLVSGSRISGTHQQYVTSNTFWPCPLCLSDFHRNAATDWHEYYALYNNMAWECMGHVLLLMGPTVDPVGLTSWGW